MKLELDKNDKKWARPSTELYSIVEVIVGEPKNRGFALSDKYLIT